MLSPSRGFRSAGRSTVSSVLYSVLTSSVLCLHLCSASSNHVKLIERKMLIMHEVQCDVLYEIGRNTVNSTCSKLQDT